MTEGYGTCRCISSVLAHEAGLADAARETGQDPLQRYECRECGRSIRSLEFDGYCRHCGGPEPDPEERHEQTRAAARQGHLTSARLLRRMGFAERARVHEEAAIAKAEGR